MIGFPFGILLNSTDLSDISRKSKNQHLNFLQFVSIPTVYGMGDTCFFQYFQKEKNLIFNTYTLIHNLFFPLAHNG